MKIIIDKEHLKREWSLNRWYEKTIYVLGIVYTIVIAFALLVELFE